MKRASLPDAAERGGRGGRGADRAVAACAAGGLFCQPTRPGQLFAPARIRRLLTLARIRPAHTLARLWLILAPALLASAVGAADFATERQAMVQEVAAMARAFGGRVNHGAVDARVLDTLARVPRHQFVPAAQRAGAYDNRPLPIGHGQTISQPYIVAVMTDLLKVRAGDKVLEIGTGSGYQAAVLADLGARVWSIEIVEPLAREATERLQRLGYAGAATKVGDGYHGWPEHGPFDAIVVTAASSHVPPPLVRQLKPGGRLVIPVGALFQTQHLMLLEKRDDGSVMARQVMPVRFVPLTGGHD